MLQLPESYLKSYPILESKQIRKIMPRIISGEYFGWNIGASTEVSEY